MSFIRTALSAAAFAVAISGAPLTAHAASSSVVTVDYVRVYNESLAGKDAQAKIKAIADQINKELGPAEQLLASEYKALEPRMKGKTPEQINAEIKKDKVFADKVANTARREDNIMTMREIRRQELSATQEKALTDLVDASMPAVEEAMRAAKASVALQRGQVLAVLPGADITADVIKRMNGKITSLNVVKVNLTRQAPPPAAPGAGAAPKPN